MPVAAVAAVLVAAVVVAIAVEIAIAAVAARAGRFNAFGRDAALAASLRF